MSLGFFERSHFGFNSMLARFDLTRNRQRCSYPCKFVSNMSSTSLTAKKANPVVTKKDYRWRLPWPRISRASLGFNAWYFYRVILLRELYQQLAERSCDTDTRAHMSVAGYVARVWKIWNCSRQGDASLNNLWESPLKHSLIIRCSLQFKIRWFGIWEILVANLATAVHPWLQKVCMLWFFLKLKVKGNWDR
jgi:hypothetical protein